MTTLLGATDWNWFQPLESVLRFGNASRFWHPEHQPGAHHRLYNEKVTRPLASWFRMACTLGLGLGTLQITRAQDVLLPGKSALGRGATVPWISYEAEHGMPRGGAQGVGPGRKLGTQDGEASGRRAVVLGVSGASIEWTALAPANSMVIRNSIPDAPGGGGQEATLGLYINGTRKASIKLNSYHSWVYGNDDNQNDNPASGPARKIYDEAQLLFPDFAIAQGDMVMLRKDAGDAAAHYAIDFIDLELVGPAISKPANFISITDKGAVPDDGQADDGALTEAVKAVQAGQFAGVYLPPGTFHQAGKVHTRNVRIQGAGMWRSKLYCPSKSVEPDGGYTGFVIAGDGSEFRDFAIFGWGGTREQGGKAFMNSAFKGTVIERVWVESVECGYWVGGKFESTGLLVKDSRFRNTGADGINFCNGTANSVIDNCHARHTGDDAFAIWSARDLFAQPCVNNLIKNSTVQLPWRAACFAIHGGRGNRIENCLGADALTYPGLTVSSAFNPYTLESATVDGLTLNRCGGSYWSPPQQFGAIWLFSAETGFANVTLRNVSIFEPTFQGIHLQSENGHAMAGVLLENMTITKPSTYGIQIKAGALGSATFKNITVGVNSSTLTLVNQSPEFNPIQIGVTHSTTGVKSGAPRLTATSAGTWPWGCNALGRSVDGSAGARSATRIVYK